MLEIETVILISGILLLLGIVSNKLSARIGVPVLLLFLVVGMLAGSEGIGRIEFENYSLGNAIGTVVLCLILFDGGLRTSHHAIRSVWKPAAVLASLGVLITAVVTGLAASWILGISVLEGLLLGSIVGSNVHDAWAIELPRSIAGCRGSNAFGCRRPDFRSAPNCRVPVCFLVSILHSRVVLFVVGWIEGCCPNHLGDVSNARGTARCVGDV